MKPCNGFPGAHQTSRASLNKSSEMRRLASENAAVVLIYKIEDMKWSADTILRTKAASIHVPKIERRTMALTEAEELISNKAPFKQNPFLEFKYDPLEPPSESIACDLIELKYNKH